METSHTFMVLGYKESPYIHDCIKSLLSQSVRSKIIISTSTPSAFIDRIASNYHLEVKVNSSGQGISSDWSFGYKQATTSYVTLAHQDDIYEPKYLERCMTAVADSTDSLIFFTGYSELVGNIERTETANLLVKKLLLLPFVLAGGLIRSKSLRRTLLSFGSPIPCPTVMYNKSLIGEFEFSRDYSINMDWDAWIRLASMEGSFRYIPERLVKHRIHESSETTSGIKDNRRRMEDVEIFKRLWPQPVANLISRLYGFSYCSNQVGGGEK